MEAKLLIEAKVSMEAKQLIEAKVPMKGRVSIEVKIPMETYSKCLYNNIVAPEEVSMIRWGRGGGQVKHGNGGTKV